MFEESIVLENVQVDNQGGLTGKVKHTGGKESSAFTDLFQRIQNHFNNEQMVSTTPHNVRRGEVYIGKSSKDKKWHRVRVETVLSTGQGYQASCYFVDDGTVEMVPLALLRHIPETYLQVPFQLKKLYLDGITPITLTISPEDLMTSKQPSYKWDTSAVYYIKKNLEQSHAFNATVLEEKPDGSLGIRLYLTVGRRQFCLNEQLVMLEYAIQSDDYDEDKMVASEATAKPKRTIADVLKSKKITKKPPAQSDSEDHVCASEPELRYGLPQTSSGSDPERGYATDSLSTQTIPHRHRLTRTNLSPQKYHCETVIQDRTAEANVNNSHKQYSHSQEQNDKICVKDSFLTRKGILDKLEANLKATSGRSSPVSDIDSQENSLIHQRHDSVRGSHTSLGRLQFSSTTVTSYHQTGSDSEISDFSTGAQSEFQTVSPISSQTVSHISSKTVSPISPQTVPHLSSHIVSPLSSQVVPHFSSQTGYKSDVMKGYQSDTSHAHITSNSAVQQKSMSCTFSDTENNRLLQTKHNTDFDSQQGHPISSHKQDSSPQGVKAKRNQPNTGSPLSALIKQLSESNSSLSGHGSPVRGRGTPLPLSPGSSPANNAVRVSNHHIQDEHMDVKILKSPTSVTSHAESNMCPVKQKKEKYAHYENRAMDKIKSPVSPINTSDSSRTRVVLEDSRQQSVFDKLSYTSTGSYNYSDKTKSGFMKTSSRSVAGEISNTHGAVPPVLGSINPDMSKVSGLSLSQPGSTNNINSKSLFGDIDIVSSDSENPFRNRKQLFKHKPRVYSSGTDTDTSNILVKSVTGQSGFTKSRLPKEVTHNNRKSPEKNLPKIVPQVRSPPSSDLETRNQLEKITRTFYTDSEQRNQSGRITRTFDTDSELRNQPERITKMFDTDSELSKPLNNRMMADSKEMLTEPAQRSNVADTTDKQKLLARITGQRMLKNLKENSGRHSTSLQEKQEKQRSKGMFGIEDNVLVHGSQPKKPIYRFSDARFAEIVSQYWIQKDFPSPQIIQAYSWPAIRQGKHVIAIAPQKTGKTLAYLCPLITSLTDQRLYKEIGVGNGPYLLILTSSWRKADAVFLESVNLLGGRPDLRLVKLHGGGQEENKACQLINGCEILVVTPPSLKRMVENNYTDLQRLCHLVIDDAEEVMENFGEEMIFIMRQYTDVISNQKSRAEAPRQILLFGTQWTGRIHSFMKTYPVEPLLIITSAFEASIYGKVQQVTHMCRENERIREVIGLLDNTTEDNRTIIFAANKQDVIKLFKIMQNYSRYCAMVHQDMENFQITQIVEEWRHGKLPLLVCCDDHVTDMKISDAQSIINYDLPSSKTKFCNRLACLRKYFWDFSSEEEQQVQPVSHLIISEDCQGSQLYQIIQLLKRSSCPVPQQLKAMIAGVKRGREEDDQKELCSQLLAFGFCRNQWKCEFRHLVISELDHPEGSDWIPDEGEVQIYITHVIDATHYFVRLISARQGEFKDDLGTVYSKLQIDMGLWYGNMSNLARHIDISETPYEGKLCGFQDRENFYRVQILHIKDMNCRGNTNIDVTYLTAVPPTTREVYYSQYWVKFVDSGRIDDIPAHKLYELPSHLEEIPFQAVEVFVCRVKPIDRDTEWTNKADMFIYNLLHNKVVDGKIVLRLGNILWLDPLVERHNLGETRAVINKAYVHRELITNGFADENPNHLEKLYKLCENKVKIPKALIKKAKIESKLETDVLPECKLYHSVVVSSVAKPDLFFIQRKEKLDELDELMALIESMMSSLDPADDVGVEFKIGDFCLAEYTSYDKRWYRGRITKIADDTCEVFFADYGDRDTVPRDKVRKIPNDDRLTDFPLQGIECKLADIVPRDCEWEEKTGDVMWDLTHFVNNDMKTFTAKVKSSKDLPDYAGRCRFVVELCDITGAQDFSLAQELISQGLGAPGEDSGLIELFERPSRALKLKMLIMQAPLEDIPDLCAALYWEQNEAAAQKIAGDINSKLSRTLSSRLIQIEEHVMKSAVCCVVKLVGRLAWPDINQVILDTVLVIARAGERLCEELLGEDCDQLIIRCLERNSAIETQCAAAKTVGKLIQASPSWRSCYEEQKYIEVLYDLFDSTDSQQIQGLVCRAFSLLCTNSSVMWYIMRKNICTALAKLLTQSADHDVIETVILFLLALQHHDSGHQDLHRESLLQAIILSLKKSNCEKCILYCVQFCSSFGSLKRKHKTVLLELEMVPCLSRILQADLSPETRQMCKDLIDSLAIKVPTQKMSGVLARTKGETVKESVVPPEIHWAQNSFNVMLSVKVKGVTNSSDLLKIQDDLIIFRAVADGVCFAFTYKLFDAVMSDHSRIRVKTSEVQISMKKVKQGKWPRLLHQKQKPANLSIDFERFVDSSDSEFCDEDEPFVLKRKKKNKAFSGTDAPKTNPGAQEPVGDSETDTTDSLENAEDPDRDRYSFFD